MRISGRIVFGLSFFLALSLRPGAPLAIENPSARISSLGGDHVAGVIPDLYTDLAVNPAYAFFADRLVVGYAKRWNPGYAPSLPYLMPGSSRYSRYSMMPNELSVRGIRLSSWRGAVFAEWALYRPESSSSDPGIAIDSRYTVRLQERQNSANDDFARIDLIAACALDDRYALGLRLQGRGYNKYSSELYTSTRDEYLDPFLSVIDYQSSQAYVRSFLGRRLSFDLQAGIVKSDDTGPRTDLSLGASLNRLDYRKEDYELAISKDYDTWGQLASYDYYRYHWNDARNGDQWDFTLALRHTFDGGIRVLAGGGVSTCSYETEWDDSETRIRWGWSNMGQKLSGAFDGDGSLLGGSCFFKGGKIFSIHGTTDLYLGLHGILARSRTEENPLIHCKLELDEGESAVRIDQPARIESMRMSFDLFVPISVEFRPSSYFTYFSSFILAGRWNKQSLTQSMLPLFRYNLPAEESAAAGPNRAGAFPRAVIEPEASTTDWSRRLYTTSALTLGFSLHYRDRFFVDVYAETEIIPSSLGSRMIDVRYAF